MRRHHQNREKEYKVKVSLNVSFIRHILSQNQHKTKLSQRVRWPKNLFYPSLCFSIKTAYNSLLGHNRLLGLN